MANTSEYGSKLNIPPASYHPLAAQQAIQKSLTLNKKCLMFILKNIRRMDHKQKHKNKTERVRGLGRKTRQKIGKGSNDNPEILDRGLTSDIPGLLSRVVANEGELKLKTRKSSHPQKSRLCCECYMVV